MVLVLAIVKASLEILGIGIGVKKWYCSGLIYMKLGEEFRFVGS